MRVIKFKGEIPVTIFEDEHEFYKHEDYLKVICPVVDEIFTVSSNKGTLNIYCSGCGSELRITRLKQKKCKGEN